MKTTIRAIAAVTSLMFAAGAAYAANAALEVNGEVFATTCKIDNNSTTKATQTLNLMKVPTSALGSTGEVAGLQTATWSITDCASQTAAQVSFENTGNIEDGRLKNSLEGTAGGATNVQIEVTEENGTAINLTATPTFTVPLTAGAGNFTLGARYYATGAATVGLVKSQVEMTVDYQ